MARRRKRTLDDEILDFAAIRARCGNRWESAFEHANDAGILLEAFASPSWNCQLCPHFLECMLENRLPE